MEFQHGQMRIAVGGREEAAMFKTLPSDDYDSRVRPRKKRGRKPRPVRCWQEMVATSDARTS